MTGIIKSEPLAVIDYVEMVNMDTMQPVDVVEGNILCAVAVKIGKTRLIDNFNDNIPQAAPFDTGSSIERRHLRDERKRV